MTHAPAALVNQLWWIGLAKVLLPLPLLWLLVHRLRESGEMACDEAASVAGASAIVSRFRRLDL
jgi:hypothetical protein